MGAVLVQLSHPPGSGGREVFALPGLRAFDCDLNAKALSDRISVHVNTVHYRLNKIADQTHAICASSWR